MRCMIQPPRSCLSSRGKIKVTVVAFVVLIGASLDAARGQDRQENYKIVGLAENDTLNVRSRPDEKSSIVTKLRNGYNGITINGEVVWNGGDDWVPILFSNAKGWVRPKYLSASAYEVASNADVPVRRATIPDTAGDTSTESPAKNRPVPNASNNNDALWLGLFVLLAGAIIMDEFSGGDTVSQDESQARYEDNKAAIEYDRQRYQRSENATAISRGDAPPYPNAPR
jgi:hypothetical protein